MSSAVANPAFVPLSEAFDLSIVEGSYELTMYIVWAGVGPLLVVPFANVYGRRPVYLLGNLIGAITNIAAGYSPTWAGILATRAFNGIAAGSPGAIGAATICDLFCMHERGFYMGIFTLFLTNGPHFAPLMGGFIAQNLGWGWCFRIPVRCSTPDRVHEDETKVGLSPRVSSNLALLSSPYSACQKLCILGTQKRTTKSTRTLIL